MHDLETAISIGGVIVIVFGTWRACLYRKARLKNSQAGQRLNTDSELTAGLCRPFAFYS
jgi:hypothetical protein